MLPPYPPTPGSYVLPGFSEWPVWGSFSYHLGVPSRGSWHFEELGFLSGLGGGKSCSEKTEVALERQPPHSEVLSKNLPAVFIDQRTCLNAVVPPIVLWETLFLCRRPSLCCVWGLGIIPFDLFSLSKVTADHLPQFCFSHICAGWRDPSLYI